MISFQLLWSSNHFNLLRLCWKLFPALTRSKAAQDFIKRRFCESKLLQTLLFKHPESKIKFISRHVSYRECQLHIVGQGVLSSSLPPLPGKVIDLDFIRLLLSYDSTNKRQSFKAESLFSEDLLKEGIFMEQNYPKICLKCTTTHPISGRASQNEYQTCFLQVISLHGIFYI